MIINHYRFTKNRLKMTVKLLKNNYAEGWEELNFVLTKDNIIQLTDDEIKDKGVYVFGFKDYQGLIKALNTQDVDVLTDDIYLRLTNKETYLYKHELIRQLKELKMENGEIRHIYLGNKKVMTVDEAISGYRPEWDMEIEYQNGNKLLIRYRGKSIVIQGWVGVKLLFEKDYKVTSKGKFNMNLVEMYHELNTSN